MDRFTIILIIIIIAGIGIYFFISNTTQNVQDIPNGEDVTIPDVTNGTTTETENGNGNGEETMTEENKTPVIGTSVEGRDITAYKYGDGKDELLFVGGIHGGYSWNTVLVAYELMDYLEANPDVIPDNVTVTVIPVLNPDGLNKTVGTSGRFTAADVPASLEETIPGRFNADNVDLNRNFDCEWAAKGTWQKRTVSGGSAPFSEPEAAALRDYVTLHTITAAVVWYSSAGGVFASSCNNGVSAETKALTNLYASASGYKPYEEFDFYEITGDAVNWLAGQGIPAISVLLTTHEDIEWTKNKAGIDAFLKHYAQ